MWLSDERKGSEVMVHRTAPSRRQRISVLTGVFALHAALLTFVMQQSVEVAPLVKPMVVAMIALEAERPAAAQPPPPSLPAKLADTFKPLFKLSIPAESESDSPSGASGVCSTPAVVHDALLFDPEAMAAIRNAPPETRSIADAVVIWNEGWSPAALASNGPLAVVRATIELSLSTVPDFCLDEPVAGPRLVPIPDAGATRTIFLVIGSGHWTWRQVVASSAIPATGGAVPVANTPMRAL